MISNVNDLPRPENAVKSLEGLVRCDVNYKEPKGWPICNQKWKYPAGSLVFHSVLGNVLFKNQRVYTQSYLFLIVLELSPRRNPEEDYVKGRLMCPEDLEFIRPKWPCTLYNVPSVRVKLSCSLLRGFLWMKMTPEYDRELRELVDPRIFSSRETIFC